MFTDIVGSTRMTARLGDRMGAELVRAHDFIVRRCLNQSGGREVKHTGDGIMASFASTELAVECATAIQQDFVRYNPGNSEPIHVRIGLDCGEPVEDSNDLFGSTVQLAARLCSAASGDQILVSENIFREYSNHDMFVQTKGHRLKGFSHTVPMFECEWSKAKISGLGPLEFVSTLETSLQWRRQFHKRGFVSRPIRAVRFDQKVVQSDNR